MDWPKGSRSGPNFDVEEISVGEEMTECGHCGARTEVVDGTETGSGRRENCVSCGQRYLVHDEIEDVGEWDDSQEPDMDEAEADRIDALLGKHESPYPDFGTF